ncbi:hypothetical protein IKL64_01565 [bacterium]|nr:hypothetical protein [bacterium]
MSFLLGAFGKLAAGRRVRDLQARMMRVQSRLRRATRQVETMSKMIETQKKMELNQITAYAQQANAMLPSLLGSRIPGMSPELLARFTGGAGFNNTPLTEEQQVQYGNFTMAMSQIKAGNEMSLAQMKQQIEEKYENMNDMMLEPLKQEQDMLQTEKDSLESQLQIAQADYDACKQMEKADAKNLKPEYTAG